MARSSRQRDPNGRFVKVSTSANTTPSPERSAMVDLDRETQVALENNKLTLERYKATLDFLEIYGW
jgi:hypothetical protein